VRTYPRIRIPGLPWRGTALVVAGVVVVAGGTALGLHEAEGPGPTLITAYFSETISVYPGSDVRVLGVPVGRVKSVTPDGQQVKAVLEVDHSVRVPAGADAVVVAPSVVADRYIQLAPAYTSGAVMPDHGTIPAARTATPAEIDQLYAAITKLSDDLGPNGVNADGALSDVLRTGAANLSGNGKALGNTIQQFGDASRTLTDNSSDLFATLSNLQKFTAMLKNNDGQVSAAESQLSSVSSFLAQDRADLGQALDDLATALDKVKTFIDSNRSELKGNVDKLSTITQTLVKEKAALSEALDDAPLAADDLLNAYDPATGTIVGRADMNELSMGASGAALSAEDGDSSAASGAAASAADQAALAASSLAQQICRVTTTTADACTGDAGTASSTATLPFALPGTAAGGPATASGSASATPSASDSGGDGK